jgi:N-acetylneuraminic acid mutarotase
MQTHQEKQEGRVELNIGGYRFETSVQTLRRVPHTFFDAYFSGRYAQDVCKDGSIFVDRDGEHFGHLLEYMWGGVVSVAEPGAQPSISLLRALKREFGFYCIELHTEEAAEPERSEIAYAISGYSGGASLSSMEQFDAASGQWRMLAPLGTARYLFGSCVLGGELYVTGGTSDNATFLSSVEKYSPLTNTWSEVVPLPTARMNPAAVTVGSDMYVLGGFTHAGIIASVLKFDSTLGTWNQVAPMPVAGFAMASCAVGSNIYLFGGSGSDNSSTSVFKFDTLAKQWSTLTPMPVSFSFSSATVLDGLVYIVGAGNGREVMSYNPTSEVWTTLTPTLQSRLGGASFVFRRMFVCGRWDTLFQQFECGALQRCQQYLDGCRRHA